MSVPWSYIDDHPWLLDMIHPNRSLPDVWLPGCFMGQIPFDVEIPRGQGRSMMSPYYLAGLPSDTGTSMVGFPHSRGITQLGGTIRVPNAREG